MALQGMLRVGVVCGALLGVSVAALAAPPAGSKATLQAQQKDVDAKLAAARAKQAALQAEVAQLEQQNTLRQRQLQQRDADIAALQQKLQAAGVPPSASSAAASH